VAKTRRCERTGKVSYRDAESAKRAMRKTDTIEGDHKPIRFFTCEWCGHIHLTSKEERSW
jgi:rubrerythrin